MGDTHTKEEYEAFFTEQERILNEALDTIENNTIKHHREKCSNTDTTVCETLLLKNYIPQLIVLVVQTREAERKKNVRKP